MVVGSMSTCDLVLPRGRVSREHLCVSFADEEALLEDLNSSAGTWVKRGGAVPVRHKRIRLEHGDRIYLGDLALIFTVDPSPGEPAAEHERRLFESVGATPGDDAVRSVLSDYLGEVGDPQGELIAIQLTGHPRPKGSALLRERELLELHRLRWVPQGVEPRSARFRRGLLDRCTWVGRTNPADRGWMTVESLTCSTREDVLLTESPFGWARPALREIVGACTGTLALLNFRDLPNLELLRLDIAIREFVVELLPGLDNLKVGTLSFGFDVDLPEAELSVLLQQLVAGLEGKVQRLRLRAKEDLAARLDPLPQRKLVIELHDPATARVIAL